VARGHRVRGFDVGREHVGGLRRPVVLERLTDRPHADPDDESEQDEHGEHLDEGETAP
jgi:hypothetical protein